MAIGASRSFKSLAAPGELWGNTISDLEDVEHNPKRYAIDLLRLFLASGVPVVLYGPPGASKTETVKSFSRYADEEGNRFLVRVVQPSTEDPMDLHGLKVITRNEKGETTTQRSMPQIVKDIVDADKQGRKTILLLDEMSTALISQQHALLGLVQSGVYGDVDISGMTAIVMAANPPGTVDVSRDLDKQFLNRAGHIPWVSQSDEWLENWREGFGCADNVPPANIQREMEGLFEEGGADVFRSLDGSWSFEDLVPHDRLELSERTAYLYTLVSRTVDEATGPGVSKNPEIRWKYKKDVAVALMGKKWGKRMATVLAKEREFVVDYKYLVDAISGSGVNHESSLQEVVDLVGTTISPGGARMPSSELGELFGTLTERLLNSLNEGTVDRAQLLTMWALLSAATPQELGIFNFAPVIIVHMKAKGEVAEGNIAQEELLPQFVPEEVKNKMKSMASLED